MLPTNEELKQFISWANRKIASLPGQAARKVSATNCNDFKCVFAALYSALGLSRAEMHAMQAQIADEILASWETRRETQNNSELQIFWEHAFSKIEAAQPSPPADDYESPSP